MAVAAAEQLQYAAGPRFIITTAMIADSIKRHEHAVAEDGKMVVNLTIGVHMADEDSAGAHTEFNQHLRLLRCLFAVEGVGDDRTARLSMRSASCLVNVLLPQRRAVWADADLPDDASARFKRFLTAEVVQHRIKKVINAGTPDLLRHKIGAEEASTEHQVQAQTLDDVQRAH